VEMYRIKKFKKAGGKNCLKAFKMLITLLNSPDYLASWN